MNRLIQAVMISVMAAPGVCASPSDTTHLADHLKSLRGIPWFSAAQHSAIESEYMAWIDSRVKAGSGIERMNAELKAAGLFPNWPENSDVSGTVNEWYQNHAGRLEPIEAKKVRGADDVMALGAGIYMGLGCSLDVTAMIYDRETLERVAHVNAAEPGSKYAYRVSGLDVGPDVSGGQRLIATGWVISNCTSTWNGKRVRIDRCGPASARPILVRDLIAQDREPDVEDVAARVEGDVVTFLYQGIAGDGALLVTPSVLRYRVADNRITRVPPIALTRAGFIHEWLNIPEPDAIRWSEPSAMAARKAVAAEIKAHGFDWINIAVCSGPPEVWEVAVRMHQTSAVYVFRIRGSKATELKMMNVARTPTPSCTSEDARDTLESIGRELPW